MATFTIFVKALTGKVIETHVSSSDTVKMLKVKVFDKTGTKPEDQRYIFAGKQLTDEQRLGDCGITKECIINLVQRIPTPQAAVPDEERELMLAKALTPVSTPAARSAQASKAKEPEPTAAPSAKPQQRSVATRLPEAEVRTVNEEQRALLARLVRLCDDFNEQFDWPKYRELKSIRQTLVEQKVLERHESE